MMAEPVIPLPPVTSATLDIFFGVQENEDLFPKGMGMELQLLGRMSGGDALPIANYQEWDCALQSTMSSIYLSQCARTVL